MSERALNEFEEKILENVAEHGCQVNHIFDCSDEFPSFSYSIGFPQTVDQPEVIIFGLSASVMQSMINELLRQCRDGFQLGDGVVVRDLLDGYDCILRSVAPDHLIDDYFASAIWYQKYLTGGKMTAAFQIFWPGVHQRLFPWEDGCTDVVKNSQPALYGRTVH